MPGQCDADEQNREPHVADTSDKKQWEYTEAGNNHGDLAREIGCPSLLNKP